jgi:hypothetical protein
MIRFIKLIERWLRYKHSMNVLARQALSTDYLVYLIRKSQIKGLTIRIIEKDGRIIELGADTPVHNDYIMQEKTMHQDEWDAVLGIREDL